jgi:hypothetical protein
LLESLGQLKSIVEEQLAAIHDRLEHVTEVVRKEVEELGAIRDIEDVKREDIQWAARNGQPVFHQLLEIAVLFLQLLQPSQFGDAQAGELQVASRRPTWRTATPPV